MTTSRKTFTETAREIPVLMDTDTDIVVVGGGTTGPFAAISAARQDKRVVMIERFGSLGGNLTLGLNTKPSGALLGGLPLEIWNLARTAGGAGDDYMALTKTGGVKIASPCDPEIMKMLLTRLCVEAGVQILFETFVSAPIIENGTITGVIIESKSGREVVTAKVVIDCSADGDMAAKANAPFVMGSGGTEEVMQPVSMYFTMTNVDLKRLADWSRTSDDIPARAIPDTIEGLGYGLWLTGFNKSLRKFQEESGITLQRDNITLKTANGIMYVNGTRVLGVDVFSPAQFSAAIVECYRQIEGVAKFLRDRVPGFETAVIGQISGLTRWNLSRINTGIAKPSWLSARPKRCWRPPESVLPCMVATLTLASSWRTATLTAHLSCSSRAFRIIAIPCAKPIRRWPDQHLERRTHAQFVTRRLSTACCAWLLPTTRMNLADHRVGQIAKLSGQAGF